MEGGCGGGGGVGWLWSARMNGDEDGVREEGPRARDRDQALSGNGGWSKTRFLEGLTAGVWVMGNQDESRRLRGDGYRWGFNFGASSRGQACYDDDGGVHDNAGMGCELGPYPECRKYFDILLHLCIQRYRYMYMYSNASLHDKADVSGTAEEGAAH